MGAVKVAPVVVCFGIAFNAFAGWVGLRGGDPETASTVLQVPVLPAPVHELGVPASVAPAGFMHPVARWGPVTAAVDSARGLAIKAAGVAPFLHFAVWLTVITTVFTTLGVRSFGRSAIGG